MMFWIQSRVGGSFSYICLAAFLCLQSKTNIWNSEDDIQPQLIKGETLPQERKKKEGFMRLPYRNLSLALSAVPCVLLPQTVFSCSWLRKPVNWVWRSAIACTSSPLKLILAIAWDIRNWTLSLFFFNLAKMCTRFSIQLICFTD